MSAADLPPWEPASLVRSKVVKASGLRAWCFHYPGGDSIELTEKAFYECRGESKGDPFILLTFRKVVGCSDEYLEDPSLTKKVR